MHSPAERGALPWGVACKKSPARTPTRLRRVSDCEGGSALRVTQLIEGKQAPENNAVHAPTLPLTSSVARILTTSMRLFSFLSNEAVVTNGRHQVGDSSQQGLWHGAR